MRYIALLHDSDGYIRLAPAYETVPTVLLPQLRHTSAVTIDGGVDLSSVDARALSSEARRWGMTETVALEVIAKTAASMRERVDDTIASAELAETITGRIDALMG